MHSLTVDVFRKGALHLDILWAGAFMENCFLVCSGGEVLIVDPGHSGAEISAKISEDGLQSVAVANTHAHVDHVAAVDVVVRKLKIPFLLHQQEEGIYGTAPLQSRLFGLKDLSFPPVSRRFRHDEEIDVGDLTLRVIHTPGHTPGGCCFYFERERVLISGDTLFSRSIGRTDLPGGNHGRLLASIRSRLLVLPDDVVVFPGHGPRTTIGEERRLNPFL